MISTITEATRKCIWGSEFLVIYVNTADNYLLAEWSGALDVTRATEGYHAVLDCLKKYPCSKVLNNNANVSRHNPGAIEWIGKVWFSSMYELGVRWFSWVYSPDTYTQISTDVVINLSSRVTVEAFYTMPDAQRWLAQQKTVDNQKAHITIWPEFDS